MTEEPTEAGQPVREPKRPHTGGVKPKLDNLKLRDRFLSAVLEKKGVKKAARAVGIGTSQVFAYLARPENREFKLAVDEARKAVADTLFEECVEIADNVSTDVITTKNGKVIPNQAAIARARLQVDTRLRVAGKLRPKEYGDVPSVQVGFQTNTNIICDEETRLHIQAMRQKLLGNRGINITYDDNVRNSGNQGRNERVLAEDTSEP